MKKKGKWILIAVLMAAAVLALILLPKKDKPVFQKGNLLENGDFSLLDENGLPQGWYTDAYVKTPGYTDYSAADGVATIVNHDLNDARFAQDVSVQPNSLYCLRGYVRADARQGHGGNLSVSNVYVFSESVYDSPEEWQEVRLYGRTGPEQKEVTVFVRLGGYSGESVGMASFRDVSLEQVEAVPADYSTTRWYKEATAAPADSGEKGEPRSAWPWLLLIALAYAALCYALRRAVLGEEKSGSSCSAWWALGGTLLLALAARIVIARLIPGYGVDISCFRAWGTRVMTGGAANFYASGDFCDYPPGYILVLGALANIGKWLGTGLTELLVKLPSILCDVAAAALLYVYGKKRISEKAAFALAALYAFNPLTFAAGAAWGQADSVMTLCLLLVVLFAIEGRWAAALPVYMLSVLMKPQALMFGPLGLIALIYELITRREKKLYIQAGIGLALAAAVGLSVVLPFSAKMDNSEGLWIVELYKGTMGYYDSATVNACNLYFLFGKNWVKVGATAEWYIRLLAALLLTGGLLGAALRGGWYRRDKLRLAALLAAAVCVAAAALLPLTYANLGTAAILLSVLLCAGLYAAGRSIRHLPLLGALMLILLCNAGSMMHERYLFPAVLLLALACILERDWRVYLLFALVSFTVFLNVGVVLDRGIRIGGSAGHLDAPAYHIVSDSAAMEYGISALNCLITLLAGMTAVSICADGKCVALPDAVGRAENGQAAAAPVWRSAAEQELERPQPMQPMKWIDWAIMLGVTAIYAVAALTNLGSTTSPQTWWRSDATYDTVTLDLGESHAVNMLYLGGIHGRDSDFVVRTSADGETWSEDYWAEMTIGQCFKWQYVCDSYQNGDKRSYTTTPKLLVGRYVQIQAQNIGTTLYEVILRDPETQAVYPVSVAQGGNQLIDGSLDIGWVSVKPHETVTLDLGDVQSVNLQYYYKSLNGDKTFAVSVSEDGNAWSAPAWMQSTEGDVFKWQYLCQAVEGENTFAFTDTPQVLTGRYVRIEAQSAGAALYEVILRDPETQEVLPVTLLTDGAEALIDEQDTFTGEPGWYNSAYFDEIYHARTGYEHYLAMTGDYTYRPYETSHPPLGKVLMAFSIGIFGMTPFGWRFAGALAGVLMLPGLYLLGKMLTKRRLLASTAMFLLAVDCMHFTQTRIATIDSFVVLFIIWSMVFMIYYIRMDYWRMSLWKTLIPLALSGVCMGLAIASKWTGCYAGVGLALLFFWSVYRRFRQSLLAKKRSGEKIEDEALASRVHTAARDMWRRPIITLASCLVFFVLIPAAIYYVSYIPYFLPSGGVTVQRIIGAAESMLWYHSQPGLGMDHPFYSPWYEWPVIAKPMWYYHSTYRPEGQSATIAAFGNPAVWWVGLLALAAVMLIWLLRHVSARGRVTLRTRQNDMRPAILLLGFAAQYVPWTLVPRGTYIYHYFPSVPFIILCTALCLDLLFDATAQPVRVPRRHLLAAVRVRGWFNGAVEEELKQRSQQALTLRLRWLPMVLTLLLLVAAAALFAAFFPYASGIWASNQWLHAMQWFDRWLYY